MTGNDTKKIGLLSSIYCTVFFNKELSGLAFSTYQLLLREVFFVASCCNLAYETRNTTLRHLSLETNMISSWADVRILYVLRFAADLGLKPNPRTWIIVLKPSCS